METLERVAAEGFAEERVKAVLTAAHARAAENDV